LQTTLKLVTAVGNVPTLLDVRRLSLTGARHVDDVHPVLEHALKVDVSRG